MTTTSILIYIFLGSASLSCGIGLGIIPYFGLGMWQLVIVSVIMMALPFFVKI